MQTDGAHCRDFAGTGPVVLKIVRVTGAVFSGITITMDRPINAPLSFLNATILYYYRYEVL